MIYLVKAKENEGTETILESSKPLKRGSNVLTEENETVTVLEVMEAPEDYSAGSQTRVKAELHEVPKWTLEQRISELEKNYRQIEQILLIAGGVTAVFFLGVYLLFRQYLF